MQVDERNSFESILERYRKALARLSGLGLRLSVTSRLRQYESDLVAVIDDPRPALEGNIVYAMAFTLREIDEIIEITEHLPDTPDVALMALLRRLHQGNANPDDDITAEAREAQYELYLGTVLRRAGIPTQHGKPDLVAHLNDRDHYLEAKRPSNPQRVDDRLRSAVHQARMFPSAGIVALSLDQVVRPKNKLLEIHDFEDLAPNVASLVQRYMSDSMPMLRGRLLDEPIDVLVLTLRMPGRVTTTGHLALGTNLHVELLVKYDSPSVAFAKHLASAYMSAQL
jgi:hypothetical protein